MEVVSVVKEWRMDYSSGSLTKKEAYVVRFRKEPINVTTELDDAPDFRVGDWVDVRVDETLLWTR